MNPKETLNHLLHPSGQKDDVKKKDEENSEANPYSVETENLAIPEVHTKDHEADLKEREEEQNRSSKKDDIVFDTLAVPEIHFKG